MSKIAIIAIIIGVIAVGSAAAFMMTSEQPAVSPVNDEPVIEPAAEPEPPKGKSIELTFEDGIAMSTGP